jgi:hypothetical protein
MDSAHLSNGLAVKYTPSSGNGANWGCDHALWLENNPTEGVIDAPGGDVTFRVNGNVFGQFGAPDIVVTATIPLGTVLVSTSPGATVNGRIITWDYFGNARTKATGSVWYTLRVSDVWPAGTVIRSLATISDASGQWRQDWGYVRVRRAGLPPNAIVLPAALR